MDIKQLMQKRPSLKQVVRFDAQRRVEAAMLEGNISVEEMRAMRDACALLGSHLALGDPNTIALSDASTAFVLVDAPTFAIGVIEPAQRDELDAQAKQVREIVVPAEAPFGRRNGFFEVRR